MSGWTSMWLLASILLYIASMVALTIAGPSTLALAILSAPGMGYGWVGYYVPKAEP